MRLVAEETFICLVFSVDSGPTLNCAYIREDLILDQSVCPINDPITAFSPIVHIDWEYWEEYLHEKASNSNSPLAFDITNDESTGLLSSSASRSAIRILLVP